VLATFLHLIGFVHEGLAPLLPVCGCIAPERGVKAGLRCSSGLKRFKSEKKLIPFSDLKLQVAPVTLFTEIKEFDEKYPVTDINKAEDLLMRAMVGQSRFTPG
jgi:hypothetical protein